MKTVSKFLATIMLLISSCAVFAQIELVHSFTERDWRNNLYFVGKIYVEYDDNYEIRNFSDVEGFVQIKVDAKNNTLSMNTFSSDFSSVTTKNFQFSSISGYEIDDVEITQHIFNNDDEYEFMVRYKLKDYNGSNESSKLILFDSKGNILKDFGSAFWLEWPNLLYLINNQSYIIVEKDYTENSAIEIYSVPTTVNPNQLKSATISNSTLSAFPNPAKTFVNLSYNVSGVEDAEMVITDASGRVVERRIVNAMQDNLRLNVANYKRGMYFYEVQGFTGRFIVE
jgi:hypothetical protein